MSADVKTFSLIFSLVIFTLTQECNFEVPRLNQIGWRCTEFRLDFLIDIVKKFVISLTSARSYSKASRCVKVFFFTCDGRRGWLPKPPMLLLRELDKTDFWNNFIFSGRTFYILLSPSNQKIFRRGKGLKTPLYFNFIEKMGKYF